MCPVRLDVLSVGRCGKVCDHELFFFLSNTYFTSVVHTAMMVTHGNRPNTGAEGSYNKASED